MTKWAELLANQPVRPQGSQPRGKTVRVRATYNRARIRVLMVLACLFCSSAAAVQGQVRFASPPDNAMVANGSPVRVNPFRTPQDVQQVQFEQIPPQVPSPADEAALSAGSSPSILSPPDVSGESVPPGAAAYDLQLASPDGTLMYTDEFIGAPLEDSLAAEAPAMVYSTNEWFRRGYWYSQQDIVAMLRTDVKNVYFSTDQSVSQMQDRPMLTSVSVTPTYAPGTRLTLGRFLGQDVANRDYTLEVAFLGLFDYTERATLSGILATALGQNNEYQFPFGVTGPGVPGFSSIVEQQFIDDMRHDILYSSDLNSLEFNFRILSRPLRDRLALQPNGSWIRYGTPSHLISYLMGLRGVSINETMRYESESLTQDFQSGLYQVRTRNDMFGLQIGTELVENYTNWSWGGRFKAAGLYNFADRRSDLRQEFFDVEFTNSENVSKENLAILLEGGLMATYQLRANLSVRVAYDAMYVTGFAIAPENMRISDTFPRFEVTGDTIYHGLSAGFEMLW